HYKGSITVGNLLEELSRFNDIGQYGGLLILEMKPSDFMLSEIARSAESVDIVLLGVHTITEPASETVKVYLKTNLEDLDIFVASLKQNNYKVIYRFDKEKNTEGLQKNYDHLMNYINM